MEGGAVDYSVSTGLRNHCDVKQNKTLNSEIRLFIGETALPEQTPASPRIGVKGRRGAEGRWGVESDLVVHDMSADTRNFLVPSKTTPCDGYGNHLIRNITPVLTVPLYCLSVLPVNKTTNTIENRFHHARVLPDQHRLI